MRNVNLVHLFLSNDRWDMPDLLDYLDQSQAKSFNDSGQDMPVRFVVRFEMVPVRCIVVFEAPV